MTDRLIPPDKLPPSDKGAEAALCGAALRDRDCLDEVSNLVGSGDFYYDAHQKIFAAAVGLHGSGTPPDAATVFGVLQGKGQGEDVGGPSYLADLLDLAPTAANAVWNAGKVRDCSLRRRLIRAATRVIRDAYDGIAPAAELVAAAESSLFDLGAEHLADPVTPIAPAVREELHRIDEIQRTGGGAAGIPTGLTDLDELTGGWRSETLYVVGARPSVGKTSFALTSALAAARGGTPTLMFSLEMSLSQLAQRHLSQASNVNLRRLRGGRRLAAGEVESLATAGGELAGLPLYASDAASLKPAEIASLTRRAVRKYGIGVVFLDYLQIVEPEDRRDNRVEQLAVITRRLVQLKKQTGLPVVCMAQLNREVEGRGAAAEPKLSDFRGSGDIEQDADDCYLLWRRRAIEDDPVWTIGLRVAKQRNGPVGDIELAFRRATARFESMGVAP